MLASMRYKFSKHVLVGGCCSRKHHLCAAGDPALTDVRPEDMSWTIRCDDEYAVTAVRLAAPQPSWAFIVQEADRCGCQCR